MRLRIKKKDLPNGEPTVLARYKVDPQMKVKRLRISISQELGVSTSRFQAYTSIHGQKIMLTDPWPLSFFLKNPKNEILIEISPMQRRSTRNNKLLDLETRESIKNKLFTHAIQAVCNGVFHDFIQGVRNLDIEELLDMSAENGWGLIHYACKSGCEPVVSINANSEKNINKETEDGWTPLQLASYYGYVNIVSQLLECESIEINKMTVERGTALHMACERDNLEIVNELLEHRTGILEDTQGKFALEYAKDPGILEIIPIYMGEWELEKYNYIEPPLPFRGHLMMYSPFLLEDKSVMLNLNYTEGNLEIFPTKKDEVDWANRLSAVKLANISNIGGIKENERTKGTFYFEIASGCLQRKFYCFDRDERDKWVYKIREGINYCQVNKIGIEPADFEIDEDFTDDMKASISSDTTVEVNIGDFEMLDELGSGSFGVVYKVKLISTGEIFAMKVLNKQFLKRNNQLKYAISECRVMKQLIHPLILSLHYAFQTSTSLYMIVEYCPQGDLERLLEETGNTGLPEKVVKFYAAEIILALEYLHNEGILYRDMKPANVLLDQKGHIRLADFGLAKEQGVSLRSTLVGTPAYISPELIKKQEGGMPADIYTYGVVLFELLTGTTPFENEDMEALFREIKGGKIRIPKHLSENARSLLRSVLENNPAKRATIFEIKDHPFFEKIDWEMIGSKRYKPPAVSRSSIGSSEGSSC